MTGAALSAKFAIGPRRAAAVLGLPFSQYRPTSSTGPWPLLASLPVWITGDSKLMAAKGFSRAKPDEVFAAVDPVLTQVGDYFVGQPTATSPVETFFIASQDVPMPIRLVLCNRTISVTRPPAQAAVGYSAGYAGRTAATDVPLLTNWGASIVQGTKGEQPQAPVRLPADVRLPWWSILLPAWPGVILHTADRITDDLGRAYTISSAELSGFGWRISAVQAET